MKAGAQVWVPPVGGANAVIVPVPPSANNLFVTFRGHRHRSGPYNKWLKLVVPIMQEQLARVPGAVSIDLTLLHGRGVMSCSDLDNMVKPVLDALCPPRYDKLGKLSKLGASIIEDDNLNVVRKVGISVADWSGAKSKRPTAQLVVIVRPHVRDLVYG